MIQEFHFWTSEYIYKILEIIILKISALLCSLAALFTIAKTLKHPQCVSTYDVIQPSKKGNPALYNNMGKLEDIMLSEISKTEKDKYCTLSLTRGKLRKSKIHRNRVGW